ncbi:hypothetical protein LPN01_05425 [Sphingomonas sp. A2-49]|uniref:hypothetical protein n=1 Tax=Sphingomonas sp. A2-49 TaxID=1391375 RepID=UPI0021CED33F|nr:hypothetical protein [Sphingomonas sp. A2-49]MCU6453512.1 hypothetical protein [Sphingomonas sp. A2-49]
MKWMLSGVMLAYGLGSAAAVSAQVSGAGGRATDARAVGISDRGVSEIFERARIKREKDARIRKLEAGKRDRLKRGSAKATTD